MASEIVGGTIAVGTVVGQRYRWSGVVGGRPRLVIEYSGASAPPAVPEPALLTLLVLTFVIAAARRG